MPQSLKSKQTKQTECKGKSITQKAKQTMLQQNPVCFTVILGEGLFRTGPLKHYRTGKLLLDSNNGEGEKGKSIKHVVGLTRET